MSQMVLDGDWPGITSSLRYARTEREARRTSAKSFAVLDLWGPRDCRVWSRKVGGFDF